MVELDRSARVAACSLTSQAADIQLRHDNQGPDQEEAAGVHADALQAVRHLQPFLSHGGHRVHKDGTPFSPTRGLHLLRPVRDMCPDWAVCLQRPSSSRMGRPGEDTGLKDRREGLWKK